MKKYLWDQPFQHWLSAFGKKIPITEATQHLATIYESKRQECQNVIHKISLENYAESIEKLLQGEVFLHVCLIWADEVVTQQPDKQIDEIEIEKDARRYTKDLYPFEKLLPFEKASLIFSSIYC